METLLHTNLSLHYWNDNNLTNSCSLCFELCAHTCFSFVHHRLWVHHDNISLCSIISHSFASWLTPHQLFSALNWCTLSFLLCPSQGVSVLWYKDFLVHIFSLFYLQVTDTAPSALQCAHTLVSPLFITVRECIMIIFLCVHILSLLFAGEWLTLHQLFSALLALCTLSFLSFAHITGCKCIKIIFPMAHPFSSLFASWLTPHQLFSASNWCTLLFLLCPSQSVSASWYYFFVRSSCLFYLQVD